MDKVINLQ